MGEWEWNVFNVTLVVQVLLTGALCWAGGASRRWRLLAPSLMTSLGILCTFIGIAIALWDLKFTPGDMQESIADMLEGMKLAFISSIIGLGAAIGFRAIAGFARPAQDQQATSVLGALTDIKEALVGRDASVRAVLDNLRVEVHDGRRDAAQQMHALQQALGGGDDSVVGRLRSMDVNMTTSSRRLADQMEGLKEAQQQGFSKIDALTEAIGEALVNNLNRLIEDLRETVGETLRKSLENLIAQIEKALIEQFGETFREFNEATQAIRQWQQDHRAQVEQLTAAFDQASTGVASIAKDCATIPDSMTELRGIIESVGAQLGMLNQQAEAFAALRAQTELTLPAIKKHLDAIGGDMKTSAEGFNGLKAVIEQALASAEAEAKSMAQATSAAIADASAKMTEAMQAQAKTSEEWLRDSALAHERNVADMAARIKTSMDEASDGMDRMTKDAIAKWSGSASQMRERLERECGDAMNRMAQDWAGYMVGIAEEFRKASAGRGR